MKPKRLKKNKVVQLRIDENMYKTLCKVVEDIEENGKVKVSVQDVIRGILNDYYAEINKNSKKESFDKISERIERRAVELFYEMDVGTAKRLFLKSASALIEHISDSDFEDEELSIKMMKLTSLIKAGTGYSKLPEFHSRILNEVDSLPTSRVASK